MRILFFGDIIGRPGRTAVTTVLPRWKSKYSSDIIIANGENSAAGKGIVPTASEELFGAGVDVLTLGNHTFNKKEALALLEAETRIIRPANYPHGTPGYGYGIYRVGGVRLAVVNLLGRTFMEPLDDPFQKAKELVALLKEQTNCILVDIHAEATSEKAALAWMLDGQVSAVVGTHTHVMTADERILPKGTAFITDVGMVGPRDSVLGVKTDIVLQKFLTHMPAKFDLADGPVIINAVLIEIDDTSGKAGIITRLVEVID